MLGVNSDVRITLKRRLAMAAAAMVHRMTMRRRPRVFLPVFPFRKGSTAVEAMTAGSKQNQSTKEKTQCREIMGVLCVNQLG